MVQGPGVRAVARQGPASRAREDYKHGEIRHVGCILHACVRGWARVQGCVAEIEALRPIASRVSSYRWQKCPGWHCERRCGPIGEVGVEGGDGASTSGAALEQPQLFCIVTGARGVGVGPPRGVWCRRCQPATHRLTRVGLPVPGDWCQVTPRRCAPVDGGGGGGHARWNGAQAARAAEYSPLTYTHTTFLSVCLPFAESLGPAPLSFHV
jgi:hypothetical protein